MASAAPGSEWQKVDRHKGASTPAGAILLISANFPPRIGGSGRWLWEVHRRLPLDQIVIAAASAPDDAAFDRSHGVRILRLPLLFPELGIASWTGWQRYRSARRTLRRVVRETHITRVHCGRVLPDGWLALSCRRPFVCFVHGEELVSTRQSRELTWMARRVFRRASLLITNSRHTAGLLAQGWDATADRIAVLPPGVDTTHFVPAPADESVRGALGWSGRTVVLTVARLQKRKGHDRLIDAVGLLRRRWPTLLYAIVGEGEEEQALRARVVQAGLAEHVRFHGALDEDDLLRAYQQCDLFALPNRTVDGDFEGFGMVLVEAQACARPVIAGDSGGTIEALQPGETGKIVDCARTDEIASAIDALLEDPSGRAKMGEKGRRWAEHFDFDALMPRALQLFARVPAR